MNAPSGSVPPRPVRLLVLDVDGTLTNSGHEVPEATRAAVRRVHEAGVRVWLATGRRYRDTLPIAHCLGIDVPLVTASGALVKRPADHATLARAEFEPGVLSGVLARVVDAGHEAILYSDSYALGFDFYCRSLTDAIDESGAFGGGGFREYLGRNRDLAHVMPELHATPPEGVFAGFVMGPHEAMATLETALAAAFPGRLSLHTIKSPRYRDWMCEIAPAGVTKWSGVTALAARWGIAADEICAVGDDVNDIPMIRAAGLGIAMGNARPEVVQVADAVVGTNDGRGIADVADMILARLA
ncbi:MAG: Cof-type HAD-IIB family hydrolase [Planctomycetia bacterium]|nr:Cof-type HAD-IIB family hydrolase [Planctomycetia bacterium]